MAMNRPGNGIVERLGNPIFRFGSRLWSTLHIYGVSEFERITVTSAGSGMSGVQTEQGQGELKPPRKAPGIAEASPQCDRIQPGCGRCVSHNTTCEYGLSADRKPPSRAYVNSLIARIAELESQSGGRSSRASSSAPKDIKPSLINAWSNSGAPDSIPGPSRHPHTNPAYSSTPVGTYLAQSQGSDPNPTPLVQFSGLLPWPSFLDPAKPFLTSETHSELIHASLTYICAYAGWVNPIRFVQGLLNFCEAERRGMSKHECRKIPAYDWSPYLHLMLLALSTQIVPHETPLCFRDPDSPPGWIYYQMGCQEFDQFESDGPTAATLRGSLCASNYLHQQGKDTLTWIHYNFSYMHYHVAGFYLNLDEAVKKGTMSLEMRDSRRSTAWAIFNSDLLWCVKNGRRSKLTPPTHLPEESGTLDLECWTLDPSIPFRPTHVTATFKATCRVALLAQRIMDKGTNVLADEPRNPSADTLLTLDSAVESWMTHLPQNLMISENPDMNSPRLYVMHMTYWSLVMMLHRPFFRTPSSCPIPTSSRNRCIHAAEMVLQLVQEYNAIYGLDKIPISLTNDAIIAGTIWKLLASEQGTDGLRGKAGLESICQLLLEMGKKWSIGAGGEWYPTIYDRAQGDLEGGKEDAARRARHEPLTRALLDKYLSHYADESVL